MRTSARARCAAACALLCLVAAACGSGGGSSGARASVVGRVLSAPSCPVERPDSPCPPRPVVGAAVVALRGQRVAAVTRTAAGGRFRLSLAPGRYVVRATNRGPLATPAQARVVLTAGETKSLTLTVDSGIR